MAGSNVQAPAIFNTLANRPLPTAPGISFGMRFFATDTGVWFTRGFDTAGNASWNADGSVTGDVMIYLDADNGVDTNPGTSALPVKTIVGAYALRDSILGGRMPTGLDRMIFAATATPYVVGTQADTTPTIFRPGYTRGSTGDRHAWVGSCADVGIGTRTVGSAGTTVVGSITVGNVVDSVGGFGVDAYVGARVLFLTGSQAGRAYIIQSNSATTPVFGGPYSGSAPIAGDTYQIQRPAVTVQNASFQKLLFSGGSMAVFGVKFTMNPAGGASAGTIAFDDGINMLMGACEFNMQAGASTGFILLTHPDTYVGFTGFFTNPAGSPWGATPVAVAGSMTAPFGPTVTSAYDSVYIHDSRQQSSAPGILVDSRSTLVANALVMRNANIVVRRGGVLGARLWAKTAYAAGAVVEVLGDAPQGSIAGNAIVHGQIINTLGAGITAGDGGTLRVSSSFGIDMTGGAGNGIALAGVGTFGYLSKITGVLTAGTGVIASNGAQIRVTDPNSGTTISGPVGAVKVGANAVDTWANILAGLTANVSDYGAASTQGVRVGV